MHDMQKEKVEDWKQFVLDNGWRVPNHFIAAVVQQPEEAITRLRALGASTRQPKAKSFDELFSLWHGRAPSEADWPAPRKLTKKGSYEWLAPELTLLATLVGQLSAEEIAKVLSERLRVITGDETAARTREGTHVAIHRIGLQSSDVIGGVTPTQAGREINSIAVVHQAIDKGDLKVRRVGRRLVIPHAEWKAWKEKRVFPPDGYVPLRTLKEPLGLVSDKLSEWARMGYVPTALRCNPYGTKGPSTQFGVWYVDAKVANQLIEDRRAGRAMPWHGKPYADNMRVTFRLWEARRHPEACETCVQIWGKEGAPKTFEEYALRYPPLAHGAKRHLTREWSPGLTIDEVAKTCAVSETQVKRAIQNGLLTARKIGRHSYVTQTDATRWKTRKCPTGDSQKSWLALDTATKLYGFTRQELDALISDGTLKSKIGDFGAMRGIVYVLRQQCVELRDKHGYTEEQAANRVGVSVEEFRVLLAGVNWRGVAGIPHVTIQQVKKRLDSRQGYTFEEAADLLGTTVEWVAAQRDKGTVRVLNTKWNADRLYISNPMLERLRAALQSPPEPERLSKDWLRLSDAADEAGVSAGTVMNWASTGELERRHSDTGWRYHRDAVRTRARHYWRTVRSHRAIPPRWLLDEIDDHQADESPSDPQEGLIFTRPVAASRERMKA